MSLRTRLTERLGIEHPIVSAPMGLFAGGRLAAAVSRAGGLGLIGGGYGDGDWLDRELSAAGNERVGCGFITWSLEKKPQLLEAALARSPAALMLSFGPPGRFAEQIKRSGVPLICQVQSKARAIEAVEAGAEIIVAQGAEAGGHSGKRSTFTLVPELADLLGKMAPSTLLVAAGGIADGRGLAAALMLGADGVLIGSRLVASREAATPEGFLPAIVAADGDSTTRTRVIDIVRNYEWPGDEFSARALRNRFIATWHGREAALAEPRTNAAEKERYWDAFHGGDAEEAAVMIGEAVGLIRAVQPTDFILEDMVLQAEDLLRGAPRYVADLRSGERLSDH